MPCHSSGLVFYTLALSLLALHASGTNIATFVDENCEDSLQNNNGPNGYPDGTCTRLDRMARFRSFQVVDLDPGCGVTIYKADESSLTCSDSAPQVAELAQCYNSTYEYYSIDNCALPSGSSLLLSAVSTSIPSSANPLSTTSSAIDASATSSTSSTTMSSTAASTIIVQQSSTPVGAIVGGVIGGVVALALIGAVLFYLLKIKKRKTPAAQLGGTPLHEAGRNTPPPTELEPAGLRAEADADSKVYYAKHSGGLRDSQVVHREPPMQEMAGDEQFRP